MNRRAFLTAVGGAWAVDALMPSPEAPSGRVVGASHGAGHLLREPGALAALRERPEERADVVVVGGGVSGLSSAWRLREAGLDVLVLELEPFVGGTSAYGEHGASPHPWGAHYLAAPNLAARATLRLLERMGVLEGWDAAGRPRFDPRVLCHAPQERLFFRGEWHKGLVPDAELTRNEEEELARFHAVEAELTARVGRDGRPAFDIPLAGSSRDPDLLALDRISMAAWLEREGFRSPFLRWYVRYALLDDFGGEPEDVSAWAGLHYFCARKLKTEELAGSHFLVWPEGNGRLVKALLELGAPRVEHGRLATKLEQDAEGVRLGYVEAGPGGPRARGVVRARAAVLATPAFVARRLHPESAGLLPERASSPWLVANLHVRRRFDPDAAWDSVLYEAEGLGYVDARHQATEPRDETVLTYYRAFGASDVAGSRRRLLGASWESLASDVLADLAPAHPGLRDSLGRLDVMLWGHGMPRPRVGFLGERPFEVDPLLGERVAFAHVDQAGIAIFEEAQASGVRAAEAVLEALGKGGESWL